MSAPSAVAAAPSDAGASPSAAAAAASAVTGEALPAAASAAAGGGGAPPAPPGDPPGGKGRGAGAPPPLPRPASAWAAPTPHRSTASARRTGVTPTAAVTRPPPQRDEAVRRAQRPRVGADENDGAAAEGAARPKAPAHDSNADRRIQRRERIFEEHHLRVGRDGTRERHALHLSVVQAAGGPHGCATPAHHNNTRMREQGQSR